MSKDGEIANVGVGLDYKYRERYPCGGINGLLDALRGLISHVSVVGLGSLEEAQAFRNGLVDCPIVHHFGGVSPANPEGPHGKTLASMNAISDALRACWSCEDIGMWRLGDFDVPYFQAPMFTLEHADHICSGIDLIQASSPVPFLAEIPSCTVVVGELDLGEFFHRIVARTGCGLVLDVSHVFSYALAMDEDASQVLRSLPLQCVQEVHIAGGRRSTLHPNRYVDSHSDPFCSEVIALLEEALPLCPRLQGVTFELGIGLDLQATLAMLGQIQKLLLRLGFMANLPLPHFQGAIIDRSM